MQSAPDRNDLKPKSLGIDFGTSNSTVGVGGRDGARLVPLESGQSTLPSAIFFPFDEAKPRFGRAAIEAYVGGEHGRLMRALKSILGTSLIHEKTRIGRHSVSFADVLRAFFHFLKRRAEDDLGRGIERAVLGRPVRFVDDDNAADAAAEGALAAIARASGLSEVAFQYEPIAAALDYEQRIAREEVVLVVDIGGGTSDFSIVRVSPERAAKPDRKNDVLANAGVHVGGTDFDRLLSLAQVMPHFGYRSWTADRKRELPSRYFHDLATWQFINRLYTGAVMSELKQIRFEAERRDLLDRFIKLVEERLGHSLALAVERAKIDLTSSASAAIDMTRFGENAEVVVGRGDFDAAIGSAVRRVVGAVQGLLIAAQLKPDAVGHIFITGGSSSVPLLRTSLTSLFPTAEVVTGDLFGSVGVGLALDAVRKFG
jgi:hypothetical chaperone protein